MDSVIWRLLHKKAGAATVTSEYESRPTRMGKLATGSGLDGSRAEAVAITVVPPRKEERGVLVVVAGGRWAERVCAYECGEESEEDSDEAREARPQGSGSWLTSSVLAHLKICQGVRTIGRAASSAWA
jgi:hypothetical protein